MTDELRRTIIEALSTEGLDVWGLTETYGAECIISEDNCPPSEYTTFFATEEEAMKAMRERIERLTGWGDDDNEPEFSLEASTGTSATLLQFGNGFGVNSLSRDFIKFAVSPMKITMANIG